MILMILLFIGTTKRQFALEADSADLVCEILAARGANCGLTGC